MNVIHVVRDGNSWLAKVGHIADGVAHSAATPSQALLGLATRLLDAWCPFDHTARSDAFPDHLRNANTVLVWRAGDSDEAGGTWHAHLGPDSDGCGLSATGSNPASALFALAQRVLQTGWRFHPDWRPE